MCTIKRKLSNNIFICVWTIFSYSIIIKFQLNVHEKTEHEITKRSASCQSFHCSHTSEVWNKTEFYLFIKCNIFKFCIWSWTKSLLICHVDRYIHRQQQQQQPRQQLAPQTIFVRHMLFRLDFHFFHADRLKIW